MTQLDVKTAYLNGKLEDEIYMRQPDGYVVEGKEDWLCLIRRGLYGLRQSAAIWYKTLKAALLQLGFSLSNYDPTLFYKLNGDKKKLLCALSWHVDDGIGIANNKETLERMKKDIASKFAIKVLGDPRFLLGIKIDRNWTSHTIRISQPAFIETVAKRFNIQMPTKPVTSPMDPNAILKRNETAIDPSMIDVPYASAIGSLNYISVATRPDISYSVNRLAQFVSSPTIEHWTAVQRIFKYLLSTKNYGITFGHQKTIDSELDLIGYSDADFAGDVQDRRSTTGWIFRANGGAISWSSRKQRLVTRSSFESELVASSQATAEALWFQRLTKELQIDLKPIPLYMDNKSAIAFNTAHVSHERTKHIDVHYHYTKENIDQGNITLYHVPGTDNPADILTKALAPYKHVLMRELLGVRRD
jgi:hypothetical protein